MDYNQYMMQQKRWLTWLIIGDVGCALLVSLVGFLVHYRTIEGWRWLATFFPVCIGWLAVAPWLGVYQEANLQNPLQTWRAALAALLSAPLAASIRGGWLNSAILPLFVLILGLTDALGFLIWRIIWFLLFRWVKRHG